MSLTRSEVEEKLAEQNVYNVLSHLSHTAKSWKGGGSINHRIVGMGYLAENGVRGIEEGRAPVDKDGTFADLQRVDEVQYELTIDMLYTLVGWRVYSP